MISLKRVGRLFAALLASLAFTAAARAGATETITFSNGVAFCGPHPSCVAVPTSLGGSYTLYTSGSGYTTIQIALDDIPVPDGYTTAISGVATGTWGNGVPPGGTTSFMELTAPLTGTDGIGRAFTGSIDLYYSKYYSSGGGGKGGGGAGWKYKMEAGFGTFTFDQICGPVTIATQPLSQTFNWDGSATLTVAPAHTSTSPYHVQWYQGTSGDTSTPVGTDSLTYVTDDLTQTTSFWARITDDCGSADTTTATITITQICIGVQVTQQPIGGVILPGESGTVSCAATGTGPIHYQWYQGWIPDTSTPIPPDAPSFDTGPLTQTTDYWVRISNACSTVDSGTAIMNVVPACTSPTITTAPVSQTVPSGASATLSVVADGSAPFYYQWYQGVEPNGTAIIGANSDTFTTPALTASTSYWVSVANDCGEVDTTTATVTVNGCGGIGSPSATSAVLIGLLGVPMWLRRRRSARV